jgi:hypothetical protein
VKQVTRNIELEQAMDLLERVPRACLCFGGNRGPRALPVGMLCKGGRYLVSIHTDAEGPPSIGQEVVLLIDEGIYYFDLRALYIRGSLQPADGTLVTCADCGWFEVVPFKTIAWDYGKLREVSDAS